MSMTVVTGGSRGIGAAACVRLAAAGHDLAIGYRSDESAAQRVEAAVRAAGRRAVTVRVDTTDSAAVQRLFDAAESQLGPITGLVNNAGVTSPIGPFVELSETDLRRVVDGSSR